MEVSNGGMVDETPEGDEDGVVDRGVGDVVFFVGVGWACGMDSLDEGEQNGCGG